MSPDDAYGRAAKEGIEAALRKDPAFAVSVGREDVLTREQAEKGRAELRAQAEAFDARFKA